ncbi:MAG: WYL domain-containing protein [Anaerolineae bacterium]|nr:WYL domain-containing protein [Anaerolineae bacterium]
MSGWGEVDEAGWITLNVAFPGYNEARMHALDLGSYVVIVAPEALRQAVITTARAILYRAEGQMPEADHAELAEAPRHNPMADFPGNKVTVT